MKRLSILITMLILTVAFLLFAQDAAQTGEQTTQQNQQEGEDNNNFVTEAMTNYLIDDFEFANTWQASMPRDYGVVSIIRREGGPADVVAEGAENNQYILGAKVEYFRTGYPWFSVTPPRPIKIPGYTKELSVWVAGRNHNNRMSFYIYDVNGKPQSVGNEALNFMGWKNITVQVPANVRQEEFRGQVEQGISFMGIHVKVDPRDSYGKYYIYFDQLMAKTDMYLETYKEEDDPLDTW